MSNDDESRRHVHILRIEEDGRRTEVVMRESHPETVPKPPGASLVYGIDVAAMTVEMDDEGRQA